jgi:hypothetical protein
VDATGAARRRRMAGSARRCRARASA